MKIQDRIHELLHKNRYTIPLLQGLGIIALVTLISVISVHYLIGDTLTDYAEANPELAYTRQTEEIPPGEADSAAEEQAQFTVPADEVKPSEPENGSAAGELTEGVSIDDAAGEATDSSDGSAVPDYNRSVMVHFYDPDPGTDSDIDSTGRKTLEPGFYYEPLSASMRDYITGISYPADASSATSDDVNIITGTPQVSYDDLRYVGLLYKDFNGLTQAGELICNCRIAQDMVEIFHELYISDYRIDSIYLVDNYGGDDTASMCADNTSCFNYRVVDGSTSLSKHAYGLAIDINPFYNPYIVFGAGEGGSDYISPPGSEIYADRSASFAYKIDDSDLCYRLFISHGFKWGGDWNSCKDYQHFQKTF